MKVHKIVFRRFYGGYELRHELISNRDYGGKGYTKMKSCYTPEGCYIGEQRMARFLCDKYGLSYIQPASKNGTVCCIGFSPTEQKWYGWSHRAIFGFGIGDKLFIEKYGNDKTPFSKHGRKKIKTLVDAKQAAINFAESVS